MASFFARRKWVHDPKARRVANKAFKHLEHAADRLTATGDDPDWHADLTLPTKDALVLLDAASKRVGAGETAAHKAAERGLKV